jgi:hypothetical protein
MIAGVRARAGLCFFACLVTASPARAEVETLSATAAAASPAVVLERAVARVDQTVFTLTELLAEARLALLREGGARAAERLRFEPGELQAVLAAVGGRPGTVGAEEVAELLSSVLAGMVQRALLVGEARRLQLRPVPDAQLRAAYEDILALGADPAAIEAALEDAGFGDVRPGQLAPPSGLAAVLRAEAMAERLVDLRARSRAILDEEELRACYAARADALGRPGFEAVRDRLEAAMRLAKVTRRLGQLVSQLESRAEVRYAPPFRPEPLPRVDACPSAEAIRR